MTDLIKKKWFAAAGAVLCMLLWGSANPVIKYSYSALAIGSSADRLMFAGVRFLAAGIMVLAFRWIRIRRFPTVQRRRLPGVALYGALQTGFMYILNYIGVANTTATKTCIITAASAFFAVILAPVFFRDERLTALKVIGVVTGFAGIVIVNLGDLGGGLRLEGEGFVLAAALLSTAGSFVGKKVSKGAVYEATAYQLIIGAGIILAVGLIMGGRVSFSPQWLGLELYLAAVSAFSFTLWTALLVHHEAGSILVFNLLIPVFGALWSLILLGERQILDPMYLISVGMIAAGIFMVNYRRKTGVVRSEE